MQRRLSQICRQLLNFALPKSCTICDALGDQNLCEACKIDFFLNKTSCCRQCGISTPCISPNSICGNCLKNKPYFDCTVSACDYAAPLDQIVLALKFGQQLHLAPLMAERIRDSLVSNGTSNKPNSLPQILCPVPLNPARLQSRGFNQSLEISKPLAHVLGIELKHDLLIRVRDTTQQALLAPDDRVQNVRDAFTINPFYAPYIKNKHIAVVDDVMTTGATLNEIAKTLKRFGAEQVSNLVFARTQNH